MSNTLVLALADDWSTFDRSVAVFGKRPQEPWDEAYGNGFL